MADVRRRKPKRVTPKPRTPSAPKPATRVAAEDVELVRAKGGKDRGGGPGGEAWVIEVAGKRAGTVFVNLIDEAPLGRHASVQIFLNKPSQGRGIGRVGYRLACERSAYNEIYAHMRKSNVASRRAAEEAGFIDASPPGHVQLLMRRSRGA